MWWWFAMMAFGAPERCNGIDDDGDGLVDEGPVLVGEDLDLDGVGALSGAWLEPDCATAAAFAPAGDCDDDDPKRHDQAVEACNGLDDDCDGEVDEDGVCGGSCDAYVINDTDVVQLCLDPLDWHAAVGSCDAMGYHLVTSRDATEHDGLYDVAAAYASDFWLGLSDEAVEGTFEWINGSSFTWDNWRYGEPNDSGYEGEDCAEMEPSGLWDDDGCDVAQPYVCETNCTPDLWFVDADGDGLGDPAQPVLACTPPTDGVANDADCDDGDSMVPRTFYVDTDGDGWGGDLQAVGCAAPGRVDVGGDCDDADDAVHPGATDVADDGTDSDCDGVDPVTPSTRDTGGLPPTTPDPGPDPRPTDNGTDAGEPTPGPTTSDAPTWRRGDEGGWQGPAAQGPDYGFGLGCRTAGVPGGSLALIGLLAVARRRR